MSEPKPVAWLHCDRREADVVTDAVKCVWGSVAVGKLAAYSIPLYEQSVVLAMQERISTLEKVAEAGIDCLPTDANAEWWFVMRPLATALRAAGYLGEGE
jgi:hypothetical protein